MKAPPRGAGHKAKKTVAEIEAAKEDVRPFLRLVRKVTADPPPHAFLRGWQRGQIEMMIQTGQMSERLGNDVLQLLGDDMQRRRRGQRSTFSLRDQIIEAAVTKVVAHEFSLSRAYKIVAEVLKEIGVHMSARTIEGTYRRCARRRREAQPAEVRVGLNARN